MGRVAEIKVLASRLEESARKAFHAALFAQGEGELDSAAFFVANLVRIRRDLEWPALLVALEATELRLGGTVAFALPSRRQVRNADPSSCYEVWGEFKATLFPEASRVSLEIVKTHRDYRLLSHPDRSRLSADGIALVRTLAHDLAAHLAVPLSW